MELMCVETVMKRREALGITDDQQPIKEPSTEQEQKNVRFIFFLNSHFFRLKFINEKKI